jgi:hypothetical protein
MLLRLLQLCVYAAEKYGRRKIWETVPLGGSKNGGEVRGIADDRVSRAGGRHLQFNMRTHWAPKPAAALLA